MRHLVFVCSILLVVMSCSREDMDPLDNPVEPRLVRTVQTSTTGGIMRVAHYNELELVAFDTIFNTGTSEAGMTYLSLYNPKGKRIRMENSIQVLYTGGWYWAWSDEYLNDTLPTVTYRYLKGNQVAKISHLYNSAFQLIQDSTYHTPNYGTYTYLTNYTYDMQGRLATTTDLNDLRDTTAHTTYQYTANTVEKTVLKINYNPYFRGVGRVVTEYNVAGQIISEKGYDGASGPLSSQTDYVYDGGGHLLKKTITAGGIVKEERYTNNAITGKPETMDYYQNNQFGYKVTYYYQ